MILDTAGLALWPLGKPTWHGTDVAYEWSRDNRAEITNGILRTAETLDAVADATSIPRENLQRTVTEWNEACLAGAYSTWQRPATSMMPINKPDFVFAPVWPIVSNTQGGPVHDRRQRILHPDGTAIEGLYAAGELGSLFGHLYLSGGNIAECFASGLTAGREAAARTGSSQA